MSNDKVKLKIDGVQIEASPGQTIIEAARDAGIYIPYLCWHPILKPYGACRMCVVQASNVPGLPASCHTAVADGQEVITSSPAIEEVRRDILALTLSEHPHGCLTCWRVEHCGPTDVCLRNVTVTDRCVVCPQNERCELQDVTYYIKLNEVPLPYKYRGLPLETRNPFIDHDMNLCIVCGKCVRACDELEGASAIAFEHRGERTIVASSLGGTLAESGCTFCGLCVDVCPVGAIVEKDNKWAGGADSMVTTTCSHCSIGCTLNLNVKKGKVVRSTFDVDGVTSHGQECARGKFGYKWIHSKDRLTTPWLKEGDQWRESSWVEATDAVARKLAGYRPEEIFLLASPKNTNEDNYVLQKLGRAALGTSNIDYVDRSCPPEALEGLEQAFGSSAATNRIWDVRDSRAVLVIDSDLTFEHPVGGLQVKEAVRRGAQLIVLDPRDTELGLQASERLVCKPGTEVAVLGGMMRVILDEGLHDQEFIRQRCELLEELESSLGQLSPQAVEGISGVSAAQITQAARLLAAHGPASILFGAGLHSQGSDLSAAVADLAMLAGNVGRPGAGVFPMRGENNSQGATDMGCTPGGLPGGATITSAGSWLPFRQAWGDKLPSQPGIGYRDMLLGVKEGRIKAMVLIGENQVLPDPQGELAEALSRLDYLVVHETFSGTLGDHADVLLPATSFAEREGSYTNLERRVQMVRPAIGPQGESRPAWQFLSEVARKMGASGFDYTAPSEIMDEIARLAPSYAGISYTRLEMGGIQWPCTGDDHAGSAMLHDPQFLRGRGRFLPVSWSPSEVGQDLMALANVSREIKGVLELGFENRVEISSADAQRIGIADGDKVSLTTAMGSIPATARVNGRASEGTVLVAMPQSVMITGMFQGSSPGVLAALAQARSYPVRIEKA